MRIFVSEVSNVDKEKAERLKTCIANSTSLDQWIGKKNWCKFFLNNDMNPATIHDPAGQNGNLGIEISKWFIKGYSAGYIIGMLCHEVGAHYLADAKMDNAKANLKKEKQKVSASTLVTDKLTGWSYNPKKADQADHIFAICYPCPRYIYYRKLLIEFCTILAGDIAGKKKYFVSGDLNDLLDCWLMDISSLLATSDARAWGPFYAKYVSTAYNKHLKKLKADAQTLSKNKLLQKAIQGLAQKSTRDVLGAYTRMTWWLLPDVSDYLTKKK